MQIKIINEAKSPLFSRKEIKAEVVFDKATPSNADLAKHIASHLKVDENLVAVKNIYTKFGATAADALVYVYDSADAKLKVEPKKKEKKAKAAPAAEKKE